MIKEFVITPAIEWLESEENEYRKYSVDMYLISIKDDTCNCDNGEYCKFGDDFSGMTIVPLSQDGLELGSYDYHRRWHEEHSPLLKYLGVAQYTQA